MHMPRWYMEDFTPGAIFNTQAIVVTREAIIEFAKQFDPQPFHLDEGAAKHSPFGTLVASGWHTASLCMRMMVDAYLNDSAFTSSPGVDALHWTKPVYPGDTLSARSTVIDAKPPQTQSRPGSVKLLWEVFNQRDDLVMRVTVLGFIKKRDT